MSVNADVIEQAQLRLRRVRLLDPSRVIPRGERATKTVQEATKGAFVRYKGELYRVANRHRYVEGRWEWFELRLESVMDGSTVWLEWEIDDDLELTQSVRKLSWSDLRDEDGEYIDSGDLKQIIGDEDSVFYQGREYEFEEYAKKVKYHPDCAAEADEAKLRILDFWADEVNALSIECWTEDGKTEYEIWLSKAVDPRSVELVAAGEG